MKHYFSIAHLYFIFLPLFVCGQQELLIKTACFKSYGVKPNAEIVLTSQTLEGSGLIAWDGQIWTHNDSGLPRIYSLDKTTGKIVKTFDLPVKNIDWEEISQDNNFLYIGNFGNNSGVRSHLQIYRLRKEALQQDKIELDSISFEWPQVNDDGKLLQVNFDCEAMIVMRDTIFLFTKEWKQRHCSRIFKIPAMPGNHTAEYVATLKTRLLITGATYTADKKSIIFCGYTLLMKPRLLIVSIPDSGNLKDIEKGMKVRIKRQFRQIEGITNFKDQEYYLIGEKSKFLLWKSDPTLYQITLK